MLAYKEKLSEKQIWELVNYIRSLGPEIGEVSLSLARLAGSLSSADEGNSAW